MNYYAYFMGFICTANPDGSIPLNAKSIADLRGAQGLKVSEGAGDVPAMQALIAQANAAADLAEVLAALFEHCTMPHKHWGEGDNTKAANAAVARAREALDRAQGIGA